MTALHVSMCRCMLATFVVLGELWQSESFNFTGKPADPIVVIDGVNSTEVQLVWNFTAAPSSSFAVIINRRRPTGSQLTQVASRNSLSGSSSAFNVPDPDTYEANLPATLVIKNVTRNDEYVYSISILDLGPGAVLVLFDEATVDVLFPPEFTSVSDDQNVVEGGSSITLECVADGEPPPNVTWTRVFDNGSDSDVLFTGEQFVLDNNRSSTGTYRCTAFNGIGTAPNRTIAVDVTYKPENVMLRVNNSNICKGDIISITCLADAKPDVDTYQLFENDTPVTDSDTAGVWKRTMSAQGNFTYRCVANNTAGTSDKNVTVTVNVPAVVYPLENITVTEYENRTLTCNVSGSPTLVTWTEVKTGARSMGITRQLTHINRNESGEYKCEASNFCGNDTKSVFLIVQYMPGNFRFVASSIEVCQDEVINFTCSADGNPAVDTYELFENNSLVTDGTNSHGMWNRTMSAGGVFIYKCVANNTVGSGQSETVTVTVNVPSVIQPIQNVNITEGGNVTLSCNASGMPSPMVSWIKVDGGERFNESELVFTNISRSQAGEYRCEASNQCGNASETATIEVQYPPDNVQLVTPAASNKACRGDVINITCSADAVPSVTSYQLFENDTAILETSDSGVWTRNYTAEGMFIYKCVANNSLGTGHSESVTVTVNVASSIQPIEKQTIMEGHNLTVVCNASGIPPPMVTWIKVGGDMTINGSELVFTNISRTQAGEYRCEASNECGNASEVAIIDVEFKPDNVSLVTSAADGKACRGDVISINCSAYAVPSEISYQLFENDIVILGASGRWSIPLSTAGMFTYKCVPNNTLGTGENASVTITVNVPSSIQPIQNKTIAEEGKNVTVSCNASGTSPLLVSWIKVDGGERFNGSELVFTHINRNQAGEYRCDASNECGNASEVATIEVQYPPENVQLNTSAVDGKTCKGEAISINCSADAVPSVTSYELFENDLMIVGTSGMRSRTLSKAGVFIYKCVANNSLGSRQSESVTVTVNVRSSIYPIQNETITEAGSVTLSCNATGIPSPMVSWIKVDGGERFNRSDLVFTNINRNEAGEYRCEASNECGNASEAARIFVQYTPEIISISVNQTANKDESVSLNCTADGYPTPTITWTKVSDNSSVSFPLMITGKQNEGLYRCTADNGIGSPATEEVFITVHLPASIEPLKNKTNVQKGGNVTLYCNASGTPTPQVSWTYVSTGEKWFSKTKVIADINVDDLGEYRCEASNRYGNATENIFIFFPGGLCEEKCTSVKPCRKFGQYFCLCEKGKKGTDCKEDDELKKTFEVGIEFTDPFKPEYDDLENAATKSYVKRVTDAVKMEFSGSGVEEVNVKKLREGSVIADMELIFEQEVGASEVDALLSEAAKDGNIGGIKVDQIKSDGVIKEPVEPEECGTFFEGEDCKKAKPGLIALCVVGGVAALGILVAIIACCVHKNKSNGASLSNGNYAQRVEPEGNMAKGGREAGRGNYGYEHDRVNGHSHPSETQMVTFKNTNPAETPGIAINDSSVTQKAQPGEGAYADLGDFHQKAPAPVTEEPLKMPPAYEKTDYAEISQFLRAPETTDEAKDESSQDDGSNLNQEESSPPESNSDNSDVRSQEILLEI